MIYHISPCFKTKKVLQHIADLITIHDYDHYSCFSQFDKEELTALLIEAAGKDGENECITQNKNLDQIIGLLKSCLKYNFKENNQKLIDALLKNSVAYYEDLMKALFEYCLEDYQRERMIWLDMAAENGDPDAVYEQYRENLA